MATFMRKIGFTYETASNGLIALEKYKSCDRRFDYVLMGKSFPADSAHINLNTQLI